MRKTVLGVSVSAWRNDNQLKGHAADAILQMLFFIPSAPGPHLSLTCFLATGIKNRQHELVAKGKKKKYYSRNVSEKRKRKKRKGLGSMRYLEHIKK